MNNELTIFNYSGAEVRTVMIDEEPWFVAADVCSVFGFSRPHDPLRMVNDKDKYLISQKDALSVGLNVGPRGILMVNEPGVYQIIFQSNKPEARQFMEWVCGEVLPMIRKTGVYMTPQKTEEILADPDLIIRLAQQVKQLKEDREKLA